MEPTSPLLIVLLLAGCAALLVLVARPAHVLVRVSSGIMAAALAMTAGIAAVNDHYGYYQSWSMLATDVSGSSPTFATPAASYRSIGGRTETGALRSVFVRGVRSGIARRVLIYLPPQYHERRYARVRFPVVELFHGSPGQPSDWIVHLRLIRAVDQMISRRLMGPVVLVMPQINAGMHYLDCVNGPRLADETYLAVDVPAYVRAHFRVSTDPASWGLAGYSSGGYCAANLALRHRAWFGAAAVLDGYFRAQDGPAGTALGNAPAAVAANSPITKAAQLPATAAPMPAFWIAAGTGDAADYTAARAFVTLIDRVEQVPFLVEAGAGHNFYAWAAALPRAMAWLWRQLAPPDLMRAFPIAGPPTSVRIQPFVVKRSRPSASPSASVPPTRRPAH